MLAACCLHGVAFGADSSGRRPNWIPAIKRNARELAVKISTGQKVPVIAKAELLVAGSSVDACFLALRAARDGKSVVLVSSDTSLPREIAIALRPWFTRENLDRLPDDVRAYFTECIGVDNLEKLAPGQTSAFDMMKITGVMEDRLLDAGVRFYYDLDPCGVRLQNRRIHDVIFGCKGGLVAVEAGMVIDCTPDARIATLSGVELATRASAKHGVIVRYSMYCQHLPTESSVTVQGIPELVDHRILVHGDFIEFKMRLPFRDRPFDESNYDLEARRVAAAAAVKLKQSGEWNTTFARGGDVLLVDPIRRMASRSVDKKLSLAACRPINIDNLLVCNTAVDVDDATARTLVEPLTGFSFLNIATPIPWQDAIAGEAPDASSVRLSTAVPGKAAGSPSQRARFTELSPIYRTNDDIAIDGLSLPVIGDCDVLVVGAGTSGMPAAMTAARSGADTVVIEKYGDVGGTHTIGGVSEFWYGRKTRFVDEIEAATRDMAERAGMPECMGMLDILMNAGAKLLPHCLAVGAVLDNRTVRGVVITTPNGLAVVTGKRIIDATGDGDVAVRAGARTEYGVRRDAMTLWYSFAQYDGAIPEARRHFAYVVDPRDPCDMTRAIIEGRRFQTTRWDWKGQDLFPQYYLTPRETRRINGGYRVTAEDILAERRFKDVITVCSSPFDIKGISDSDLMLSGYVSWSEPYRVFDVQIPYRAIIPVDLDNILVVGKAYSSSHDAMSLARMQKDMMAMGGAAGVIAAGSARGKTPLRDVDIAPVQQRLVELGILTDADLQSIQGIGPGGLPELGEQALRQMVQQNFYGKNEDLSAQVKVFIRPQESLPLLRQAFANADGPAKVEYARALCYLGDTSGADVLVAEIERLIAGKRLPGLTRFPPDFTLPHQLPDGGYEPDPTYYLNTLSRLGDKRIIPMMTEIARKVDPEPHVPGPTFSYIFSLCYAAERLADPACLEALHILEARPGVLGDAEPDREASLAWVQADEAATTPRQGVSWTSTAASLGTKVLRIDSGTDQTAVGAWAFAVEKAGEVKYLALCYATPQDTVKIQLSLNGTPLAGQMLRPSGGWGGSANEWCWAYAPVNSTLEPGKHELELTITGGKVLVDCLAVLPGKPGASLRPMGTDPRQVALGAQSIRDDRYAYLELCVGRAMARCGAREGYALLIAYLQDIRGSLARSAHEELVNLSGQDFSYDTAAWRKWLATAKHAPIPYRPDAYHGDD